ncbi:type II toxin-antitoxin system PemK/MazF family toxin [Halochromatium roseum]|uniref:type II toxin-antitoxin system PemK/MazF family toxin n=1 Tax=Halochromatium roseum TaxID=391920 RepID=UPI001F5D2948|nr:type II toxin-antitoxin system PemK/MazF family toxin [Halochromatium roseum]
MRRQRRPTRNLDRESDIVFVDFEPTKGKEIGKYRPALVLRAGLITRRLACSSAARSAPVSGVRPQRCSIWPRRGL